MTGMTTTSIRPSAVRISVRSCMPISPLGDISSVLQPASNTTAPTQNMRKTEARDFLITVYLTILGYAIGDLAPGAF
ncbi:hypothetical protein DYGSA30_38190 [Dyella sp. GSA-30]|nr:hypothetical protein DYGSA30_38190 [Dyella sp. GSA-30]